MRGPQGIRQFEEVLRGLFLVRSGRVRIILIEQLGRQLLPVVDSLALLDCFARGKPFLLFGRQERRQHFELLEERFQIAIQIPLVVCLFGVRRHGAAAPATIVLHLLGESERFDPQFILIASAAFQALGGLVERLDRVVLEQQSLQVLDHHAMALVGLLGFIRRGLVVRRLDRGFEMSDDRFHLVLGETIQRLGRVGEEFLLFALVQMMIGQEAEHRPQPASNLLGLALDPALGIGLIGGNRPASRDRLLSKSGDGNRERGASDKGQATRRHGNSSSVGPERRQLDRKELKRIGRWQDTRRGRDPDSNVLMDYPTIFGRMQS